MSSGSNNSSKKVPVSLPLPPKRKSTTFVAPKPSQQQHLQQQQQQCGLYPNMLGNNHFSPGAAGHPQNPLLPAGVNFAHGLAGFVNHHHHHPSAQVVGTASNGMMTPTSSAAASHAAIAPAPTQSTPGSASFFQGWKLRSGKWLEEEEAYAEVLIDMFDRGQLSDCMTGSTLRAYLAQKLHCAPMRISKKFAGKGIGKKVYSCRIDNRKNVPTTVAEQRRKLQQKAEDIQKAFHEAASCDAQPELPAAAMVANFAPMITTPVGMQFAVPSMAAAQHFFPQMAQNGFFFANHHHHQQQQQQQGQTVQSIPSGTVPITQTATAPPAPKSVNSMAQLQESYMKALSGQPNIATSSGGTAQITTNNNYAASQAPAPTPLGASHSSATSSSSGPVQAVSSGGASSQQQQTTIANPPGNLLSRLGSADSTHPGANILVPSWGIPHQGSNNSNPTTLQATNTNQGPQQQSISSHAPGAQQNPAMTVKAEATSMAIDPTAKMATMEQPNFPDFMAGFDKVALSMKPVQVSATSATGAQQVLECSPPMTSRSFDDFHRLLGKDLTPLDDGEAQAALNESPVKVDTQGQDGNSKSDKVLLDTTALFTAESYAMFAQESALAASQHAAYLARSHDQMPGRNHRMGSFDFDSTMKLVSQHVPIAPRGDPLPMSALKPETNKQPRASFVSVFPMQPSTKEKQQLEKSLTMTAAIATQPPRRETRKSAPVVSGSEPTSSAAESSFKGSTSESNGSDNTFSNSDDGHFESGDESHSSDDFSYDTTGGSSHRKTNKPGDGDDSFSPGQFDESSLDDYHDSAGRNRRHNKKRKLSMGSS